VCLLRIESSVRKGRFGLHQDFSLRHKLHDGHNENSRAIDASGVDVCALLEVLEVERLPRAPLVAVFARVGNDMSPNRVPCLRPKLLLGVLLFRLTCWGVMSPDGDLSTTKLPVSFERRFSVVSFDIVADGNMSTCAHTIREPLLDSPGPFKGGCLLRNISSHTGSTR
jgi:hypothetical protein